MKFARKRARLLSRIARSDGKCDIKCAGCEVLSQIKRSCRQDHERPVYIREARLVKEPGVIFEDKVPWAKKPIRVIEVAARLGGRQKFCTRACKIATHRLRVRARLLRSRRWGLARIAVELKVDLERVRQWVKE